MRRRSLDIAIIILFFLIPLVLFFPQTIGGQTLLPAENLYQFQPFAADRDALNVPLPHNHLLSDLVLQNFQWKSFIRESLAQGEIPLWNPHQFSGLPFFAAGQPSTLYPFSLIYYILPLPSAYGWFTVIQLGLAGVFMFALMRGLRVGRSGSLIAGVVYQLSGMMVVSAVFPMIIGAAVWLPLILLMIEKILRQDVIMGRDGTPLWVSLGGMALGCCVLSGHVEITYYTLLISGYYAAFRLVVMLWQRRNLRAFIVRGVWLLSVVVLGMGLGAVQFLPIFEVASLNFRSGSVTLAEVREWAHPIRDVLLFLMPNVYGSSAHHGYFDLFQNTWVNLDAGTYTNLAGNTFRTIDWGFKNYVEGAVYIGILPLILTVYALMDRWVFHRRAHEASEPPYRIIFASLGGLALTFMFGLPTYALLFKLPGIDQLHSPFRWIFALTLCLAALAAFGWDALLKNSLLQRGRRLTAGFGSALIMIGLGIWIALGLGYALFPQLEPTLTRLIGSLALAENAFTDAQMFFSYQFTNLFTFGGLILAGGVLIFVTPRLLTTSRKITSLIKLAPALLIALDLTIAWWGFNPASNAEWLDYVPPSIAWLQDQEGDWRYTTLNDPTTAAPDLLQANMTMRYGFDDIRGYESIITRQYVDYIATLAPQVQLDHNRVSPLYTVYPPEVPFDYRDALNSPILDQLNVRFVISHTTTTVDVPNFALAYEDHAVRIWENLDVLPRTYLINDAGDIIPATITYDTGREKFVDVSVPDAGSWRLIVSESYLDGWRAFIRPLGGEADLEQEIPVQLDLGNLQRINLPDAGDYTLRVVYSSQSFQIGLFTSFIGVVVILLLVGSWLWSVALGKPKGETHSSANLFARNSIAPILLNLFNRGIDFAFAFVMLRVLGPEGSGNYTYAGVIFMWFDILTNFGMNLYLTREVARDRSRAGHIFLNTSALRLGFSTLGIPLLIAILALRNATVEPPLNIETLIAIGLLYIGLIPGSFSTGMTALYYAFERAEIPAVVSTIATICKAVFGLFALLMGWGIIGLAAVSILTNFVTFGFLAWNGRSMINLKRGQARPEKSIMKRMIGESYPLMLNHFLATIFFQIDVIILEALQGARIVGQYGVAYRWLSALNVIPAFFTQGMLPRMSRQAHSDREGLKRNYILSIKVLVSMALPVAVIFTFAAEPLVSLLGGADYLPNAAIATQIMIWSIPIGWMNSLTQYVLIALDLQKRITRAFFIAVAFNIVANFLLIPQFGFQAAALTTIASEAVLWVPFVFLLQKEIGAIPWVAMLWRQVIAIGVMVGVMLFLWNVQSLLACLVGLVVYAVLWMLLGVLSSEERERLGNLLPARFKLRRSAA